MKKRRIGRHTLLRRIERGAGKALKAFLKLTGNLNLKRVGIVAGGLLAVVILCVVLFSDKPNDVQANVAAVPTQTAGIVMPTPAITPEPTPEPTLHPLNSPFLQGVDSPVVADIQQRLMELGYMDEDEPTEHYGPITKGSVKLFQRQHGLTSDGAVGPETYNLLMSEDAQKYTISEGVEGTDVKELQIRLRELGYINVATSYYGTETAAAVKKFQNRNGLSPDGKVGEKTRELLYSEDARANAYAYGEESPEIKKFQERLAKLGYYSGAADGKYGKDTATAVKRFQERNSLIADGYVGPQTKSLLLSKNAQPNAVVLGMRGSDVEKIQTRLKALKYLKSVTGYYGTDTVNAVSAFQQLNGLKADGKVGAVTMTKLMSDKAKAWTSTKAPPAAGSGGGGGGNAGPAKNLSGVEALIAVAQSKIGAPYVRGGKGPSSFDCSGFVYWCLNQAGVKQGYMTSASWQKTDRYPRAGSLSSAQRGDVLSFRGHVGIALGGGKMIDASSSQGKIRITDLKTPYWQRNFVAVYRVF